MNILEVKNLSVGFRINQGEVRAVDNLSFNLETNEVLGIVGESGSGKSQSVYAIMGLLARNGYSSGSAKLNGKEILGLKENELNKIRASEISIVFQDPMTSLNPHIRVSEQLIETLVFHKNMSKSEAKKISLQMLDAVKIPEANKRINMFPHEFSGGMRQRVAIAMALLCKPKLLIADEPTTALDVTVQANILELFKDIRKDFGTSIILITHDLGVVAGICDNVLVMYAGGMMEYGSCDDVFYTPTHPYTKGLLKATPILGSKGILQTIPGEPPNLLKLSKTACPFVARCEYKVESCSIKKPDIEYFENRARACHIDKESL